MRDTFIDHLSLLVSIPIPGALITHNIEARMSFISRVSLSVFQIEQEITRILNNLFDNLLLMIAVSNKI